MKEFKTKEAIERLDEWVINFEKETGIKAPEYLNKNITYCKQTCTNEGAINNHALFFLFFGPNSCSTSAVLFMIRQVGPMHFYNEFEWKLETPSPPIFSGLAKEKLVHFYQNWLNLTHFIFYHLKTFVGFAGILLL